MDTHRRALRAARGVAHAASQLASEAATLARAYAEHGQAADASIAASEAAVRAAKIALDLDVAPDGGDHDRGALEAALSSLEAAAVSVAATRSALDAALSVSARKTAGMQRADG